jgi:hypothetical protein
VSWRRRAATLHEELRAVAEVGRADPRWWVIAGGAALPWGRGAYVLSDAEPGADTFIGHAAAVPEDPVAWAIAGVHAARAAIRELDGELPEQPLAVTIERGVHGAVTLPSALGVAAIACGDRVIHVTPVERGGALTIEPARSAAVPFVTVSLGDEPLASARHGHRRGWISNGVSSGPWLGLAHAGGLDLASTCHMVVDGFGHAWLTARIAELRRRYLPRVATSELCAQIAPLGPFGPLAPVTTEYALGIAWRPLAEPMRTLPLAYALGRRLHRLAGNPSARFSPTFQIPVAARPHHDPDRLRYRHVPAIASVRFDGGEAEPYAAFEARTRIQLAREAHGDGVGARLVATARAVPAPLVWKRNAIGGKRPRWLDAIAEIIGGRACLSRIRVEESLPPSCAVSAPARTEGIVVTLLESRDHAAITLCGDVSDTRAGTLLDELLAL